MHGNLNPYQIFMKENGKISEFKFISLFDCIWQPKDSTRYPDTALSIHDFDFRLRMGDYLSPEQANLGEQYQAILFEVERGAIEFNHPDA
jgi:hypothetical protein